MKTFCNRYTMSQMSTKNEAALMTFISHRVFSDYFVYLPDGGIMKLKQKKLSLVLSRLLSTALSTGAVAAFVSAPALAQDAAKAVPAPAPQKIEKIEVTGSNIKRVEAESASPIQVITRDEIERSGKQTVTELLRTLPSAGGGGLNDLAGSNSFSPGASSASLRGLGSSATLILLNGRRIAPYGLSDPNYGQSAVVNLDAIPFDAIDRVEILKDGASAIYGSEAIAGVINIILRKDFKGGIVGVTGSTNLKGIYNTGDIVATVGFGDLARDRYNIFVNVEGYSRERVTFRESEKYLNRSEFFNSTRYRTGQKAFSSYAPQLNLYPGVVFDPDTLGGAFIYTGAGSANQNTCPPGQKLPGQTVCRYDVFGDTEVVAKSDRANLFTRGTFDLNATTNLYGEIAFNQLKTKYLGAPQVAGDFGYWYASATNKIINIPEVLPPNNPSNPTGDYVGYRYRFTDVGLTGTDVTSNSTRFVLGAKTALGTWDVEAGALYSESKTDAISTNQVRTSVLTKAILDGTYNFLSPSTGKITAKDLRVNSKDTAKSSFTILDIKTSTELGNLPGGPVGFAAGLEYRREDRQASPDVLKTTGEILGYGASSADGKRDITGVFLELNLPVWKSVDIQLAGRNDQYSDYGRSSIPKVGITWTVLPALKLRSSYSEGFRAPSLTEISKSSTSAFTQVSDPIKCVNGDENQCQQNIGLLIQANPNVRPETAKTSNAGIVFDLSQDASVTVDFYRIDRKNEINILSLSQILNNENNPSPLYKGRVQRGPAAPGELVGDIQSIRTGFINVGRTVTSGVDLDFNAKFSLGAYGKLSTNALVTYTSVYKNSPEDGSGYTTYVDYRDYPRVRGTLRTVWETGNWATTLTARYFSGFHTYSNGDPSAVTCNSKAASSIYLGYCRVTEQVTFDLGTQYRGIKDLVLSATVQNIGNLRPSADPLSRPANTDWFSQNGAYLTLGGKYTFR